MPVTSSWCQGSVPCLRNRSQAAVAISSLRERLQRRGYGIVQLWGKQSHAERQHYILLSLGTCSRTISGIIRAEILLSGDVEETPGLVFRGAQWDCSGHTQGKQLALDKTLIEEKTSFCLPCETKLSSLE
ncbi:uncharacterized protein TEOVI_000533400 [Trypanosoma equiperdum]|uniref:Uncharacterized protein n=1 Tax=Trypanosoma equiperdum TaxID=5694 RepID=A0A1G4I0U5_TRYEQ|nr:hypothetical protein TEOVI_000533400 [Trypanosoma equiperdum]